MADHLGAAGAMNSWAASPFLEPLSPGVRLGYASGSLATGIFSTVPAILLLFYCTEVLVLPPGWAAVIMLVPKAWSVAWDPLVGSWSDRVRDVRGLLVAGAAGVVVCFAFVFATPWHGSLAAACWVGLCYFGLATFYSVYSVPYMSLPARRVRADGERARLISWRMVFAMLGVLAGAGIAPVIVQQGATPRDGYRLMGASLAMVCAVAMMGPLLVLPALPQPTGRPRSLGQSTAVSLRLQLGAVVASRDFRALLLAYLLQLTAASIFSSVAPYLVTYVFKRPAGDTGLALGLLLAITTGCIQPWASLAHRIGERAALVAAVLGYAAATLALGAATLVPATWPVAVVVFAAAGVPFGGLQVLPFIMSARIIARDGAGLAEGALTGVWTASEKLGLALGPTLTGAAFALLGGVQTGRMRAFVMLAPAALVLMSLMFAPASPAPEATGKSS
jgi:Na+/melibiose symporter-like transporter